MGGVAGFFDKELKNSRVGILKESENIHVWFQNCYSFNNLVSIYTKSTISNKLFISFTIELKMPTHRYPHGFCNDQWFAKLTWYIY